MSDSSKMFKLINPVYCLFVFILGVASSSYAEDSIVLTKNNALSEIRSEMQSDQLFSRVEIKDGRLGFSINDQKARWYVESQKAGEMVFVVYRMSSLPKDDGFKSFVRSFSPANKSHIYFGNYVQDYSEYLAIQQQVNLDGASYQDVRNAVIDAYNDLVDFMGAYRNASN